MITCVLGAPGSGKSTLAPLIRRALPTHVVVDWDAFMVAASELAGRDVRRSPTTWPSYRHLVRAIVETIGRKPLVLLTVCTPDELHGWPIDAWILLDCADEERRQRLGANHDAGEVREALEDAARYRSLGLAVLDSTGMAPQAVAAALAGLIDGDVRRRP